MRVLVAGLGKSGRAMIDAALAAGWSVRAADSRADLDPRALLSSVGASVGLGVQVTLGSLGPDLLGDAEVVLASPGLEPTTPLLAAAVERGVPVWSEPEVAWQLNGGRTRLLGVTGTNGKTTTTEMIAAALEIPAAGNIGTPLVEVLSADDPPPLLVAELSSFQLHFIHDLRPDVAALLNVADDHLDWHGGYQPYADAKARLWRNQRASDALVYPAADAGAATTVAAHPPPGHSFAVAADDGVLDLDALRAPGPHNALNATVAARCAIAAGGDVDQIRTRLQDFEPGGHRVEHVATVDGIDYVDDSKATNPHAAVAAIRSFDSVVLIAGGRNKGLSFDALIPALREHVRLVVTNGECAADIAEVARRAGVEVRAGSDQAGAIAIAARLARPGDTVLLAPAAASFDQFTGYAQRGDAFRTAVRALQQGTSAQEGNA